MRIINKEEGFFIVEIVGFEVIDSEFYIKMKNSETEFYISSNDFIKSMSKKWKKINE